MKKLSQKAQQLVEFVIILPILIIILVVIIEIGFVLNAKLSLAEAIKASLFQINTLYNNSDNQTLKTQYIKDQLKIYIEDYFFSHNLPVNTNNTISVGINNIGNNTALVSAHYKYSPVFVLPNILNSNIIPANYTIVSTQAVNNMLIQSDNFSNSLTNANLTSFSGSKTSILISKAIGVITDARKYIAFLIGFDSSSDYKYARLFDWWGNDILPANTALNLETGKVRVKDLSNTWVDDNTNSFVDVLANRGYTHAIYAKMDTNPNFQDYQFNLSSSNTTLNAGIPWCNQSGKASCDSDISSQTFDILNKRGISFLLDSNNGAYGSFDSVVGNSTNSTLNVIKNQKFSNANSSYILRLYSPNTLNQTTLTTATTSEELTKLIQSGGAFDPMKKVQH